MLQLISKGCAPPASAIDNQDFQRGLRHASTGNRGLRARQRNVAGSGPTGQEYFFSRKCWFLIALKSDRAQTTHSSGRPASRSLRAGHSPRGAPELVVNANSRLIAWAQSVLGGLR